MYDANREKGMEILENQIDIQEQTNEETKGKSSALVVAATCMIAFMGVGLVDPILKTIAAQLNATPAETTLLFTSYMLVTGVVMLFTGFLSSRIGLKKTLMTGLFIIVVRWSWRIIWEYRNADWVTCRLGCRECFICLYCFSNDRQYFSW